MIEDELVIVGLRQRRPFPAKISGLLRRLVDRAGQDDFDVGVAGPDPACQGETSLIRPLMPVSHISEHNLDRYLTFGDKYPGFSSVAGLQDAIAALAQILGERISDQNVGVDDKYCWFIFMFHWTGAILKF